MRLITLTRPRKQLGRRELNVSPAVGLKIELTMLASQGSEAEHEIEVEIETPRTPCEWHQAVKAQLYCLIGEFLIKNGRVFPGQ